MSPSHSATMTSLASRYHCHGHPVIGSNPTIGCGVTPRAPSATHPSPPRANAAGVSRSGKPNASSPISVTGAVTSVHCHHPSSPFPVSAMWDRVETALPLSPCLHPSPSLSPFLADTWARGHNADATVTADVGRVAHLSSTHTHHTHSAGYTLENARYTRLVYKES